MDRCVDRHSSSLFSKVWLQKISEANITCEDSEIDREFTTLLNQLCGDDDITVKDVITFDDNVTTSPWPNTHWGNNETLFGIDSEVSNAVENIKIPSLWQNNITRFC